MECINVYLVPGSINEPGAIDVPPPVGIPHPVAFLDTADSLPAGLSLRRLRVPKAP